MYNTIDVDTNDKVVIDRISRKIRLCNYIRGLEMAYSAHKGVHFRLVCDSECEVCRMVFDDPTRYGYDQFRPVASQNVLFSEYRRWKKNDGNR